uniref:Myotilin n=1 Tax=Sinocyclocheilus rhinocerous TaxID=307959 RepID=A0A673I533_9TELE
MDLYFSRKQQFEDENILMMDLVLTNMQKNFFPMDCFHSLPKPILKKTVSRPVSRSTDQEIQGSKDALIQDLEKKLRNKAPQQRTIQKMSYEERMARRLLGADNAASVFDLENSFSSQHTLFHLHLFLHRSRKNRPGGDGTEASAIQEKCFAPRFIQVPQDLSVEEGRFCRIDFKVVGLPTADISWYLDGKLIRPDDYHKMLVCEKSVHSFIIEIVTIHHAGVYECVAKNRAGESHFSLRLDVIAQEQLCPPSFVVKMRNSRVLEGDGVRLECKVTASPAPQLYWKKDKEMLRVDPMRMSLSQDASGKQCLVIDPVIKSDAGWYTVSAINEAGMSTCNARLDVASKCTYRVCSTHFIFKTCLKVCLLRLLLKTLSKLTFRCIDITKLYIFVFIKLSLWCCLVIFE